MNSRWLYYLVTGEKPARARRTRAGRKGPARDWKYRQWIRSLPCLVCKTIVGIEAAHTGSDGGKAQKSSDFSAVPLCSDCHTFGAEAYHRIGRKEFERWHGLDLAAVVKQLNQMWRLGRQEAA